MSSYINSTTNLLKDNSWIRKVDDEDEDIDRDPNYAKTVLSHSVTHTTVEGSEADDNMTTTPIRTSTTSVHDLTKRFGGSQDELWSSTLPSSTTSSYTKSSYSSLKSDYPKTTTTTTVTKDGITETTVTTNQSLRSPVTTTFSERVKSSSKGSQYSSYSPTKTTKVTETTVSSLNDAEDHLYNTLIPSSIKDDLPLSESIRTTVRSSGDGDGYRTTTTTRTSSTAEDDLYGTLLPKAITSNLSSPARGESPTLSSPSYSRRSTSYSSYTDDIPSTRTTSYTISTMPSDDYSSDSKTYSYTRPESSYEYSSNTIPSVYSSSTYKTSRSDDSLSDPIYSKSSTSVYSSSDRTVHEKDLCSYCRKPFTGDAKMVLDDIKINCHASCFKCQVCHKSLGHMKAGDSLWVYKRMVYCENCFDNTREKWLR